MPCENLGWRHRIAHVLGIANPRVCLSELAKFSLADFKKGLEDDIMTKANVHLIEDENLGGLLREYVESDRKADVGDYVVIVNAKKTERDRCPFDDGHISTVISTSDDSVKIKPFAKIYDYEYRTLDPTDCIRVDEDGNGRRYKLVDRQAEVGEKVIITESNDFPIGYISEVERLHICGDGSVFLVDEYHGTHLVDIQVENYFVLEPVKNASKLDELLAKVTPENKHAEITVDESQASPEVIDMLGNLAQRIVKLESQVEDNLEALEGQALTIKRLEDEIDTLHSNQKRMAEELENAKPVEVTTPTFEIDSAEVIVELAKLLARESRKVGRL